MRVHAQPDLFGVDDAVIVHVLAGDTLDGEHRPVHLFEDVDHLTQRRRIGVDHVVAEDDGERFVADQRAGDQHRVAEAERLSLADIGEVDQVRDVADLGEQVLLPSRFEERLELDRHVEVILDRVLAAPGDEDDVVDARGHSFSTPYWMMGLSTSGSISFGCALVTAGTGYQNRGWKDRFANDLLHQSTPTDACPIFTPPRTKRAAETPAQVSIVPQENGVRV